MSEQHQPHAAASEIGKEGSRALRQVLQVALRAAEVRARRQIQRDRLAAGKARADGAVAAVSRPGTDRPAPAPAAATRRGPVAALTTGGLAAGLAASLTVGGRTDRGRAAELVSEAERRGAMIRDDAEGTADRIRSAASAEATTIRREAQEESRRDDAASAAGVSLGMPGYLLSLAVAHAIVDHDGDLADPRTTEQLGSHIDALIATAPEFDREGAGSPGASVATEAAAGDWVTAIEEFLRTSGASEDAQMAITESARDYIGPPEEVLGAQSEGGSARPAASAGDVERGYEAEL